MLLSANLRFLLDRRGVPATLRKFTYGSYDPETGTNTSSTIDHTVNMYFSEYMLSEVGGNILLGDRKILISPVDTTGFATPEPDTDDVIVGQGDTVSVVSTQKIYNGSTLVCYICQARE